jgi:hypothetical protein
LFGPVALGHVHAYIPAVKEKWTLQRGHIAAAFVGIVVLAALRARDPSDPVAQANPAMAVLWTALMFGALWECIVRLWKLFRGIQDRRSSQ